MKPPSLCINLQLWSNLRFVVSRISKSLIVVKFWVSITTWDSNTSQESKPVLHVSPSLMVLLQFILRAIRSKATSTAVQATTTISASSENFRFRRDDSAPVWCEWLFANVSSLSFLFDSLVQWPKKFSARHETLYKATFTILHQKSASSEQKICADFKRRYTFLYVNFTPTNSESWRTKEFAPRCDLPKHREIANILLDLLTNT